MMSQAAAAAAPGEPESSSLLCIKGVGPEKQPTLGNGPVPGAHLSATLGRHKDNCRTRGSWQHFAAAGCVP
jgi:hypothetical protein